MNDEDPAPGNDQPKKPGEAAAARSNRPTTIDLKATEIKPEPAQEPPASSPPPPQPESSGAASAEAGTGPDTAPPRQDAAPKNSPWPAVGIAAAAAVVFFAVGLGAGHWLSDRLSAQRAAAPAQVATTPSPELLARIDKLEARVAAQQKEDPQLQSRLAKLEAQLGAPRASDQQLIARIAAAEAAVKTLADVTASREKRSDDIAALAREARERASNAASAAEAAQKAQSGSPESRADVEALSARVATLEQATRNHQAELARRATVDDAKGRFAIAAIALREAVDGGMPFTAELAVVKSLSGDSAAFAALEPLAASGVPSSEALARELAGLMPAIWKVARKDEAQQGTFLERLQANASKIVRIRPAGDVVGDDPTSVSARIESRADRADIRGALAELAKLPADARAPAEGWIKKAQARNAAIAAARNVSQTALSALTKSGS
jgi:hypothetical protein